MIKKYLVRLNIIFFVLLFKNTIFASCLPDHDGMIEIGGQKKLMIDHINNLKINKDKNNKFTNTHIVTYSDKTFTVLGSVSDCSEECLEIISKCEYTYVPFYTIEKSKSFHKIFGYLFKRFGAIIVGHRDLNLGHKLHSSAIKNNVKINK